MNASLDSVNPLDARVVFNKRRTAVIGAGFGLVVFFAVTLVLALLGGGWFAPLVGLLSAVGWLAVAWLRADSIVLKLSGVEGADEERHARLFNVTAGLCAAMGVPNPQLYVLDELTMNALATGRDRRNASLVVTQGLLDELSLVELESVVALLLHKVKAQDVLPETFLVPTVGASGVLSELTGNIDWLSRALASPMRGIEKVIEQVHPSRGELDTDIAAVSATRYPPALASALEKMNGRSAVTAASPVTDHLWIAPPSGMNSRPSVARIHAQLPERIAVLNEL